MVALVLDAFAHTAEAVTGAAYGAKNKARFNKAVKLTTEFSVLFAILIALSIYFLGPYFIAVLTKDPAVIESALRYLPYCALAPIAGFAAWQLDGIFIGTTRTREMRNAGIMAVAIYITAHYVLTPMLGNDGIWIAFLIYYISRAVTLAFYFPNIRKQMD